MPVTSYDPLLGFKFHVRITNFGSDNILLGFMKVGGLEAEIGILEQPEISDAITPFKLPDRIALTDITLERGVAPDRNTRKLMWDWYEQVVAALASGSPADFRRTVVITAVGKGPSSYERDNPKWHVYSAFPKAIKFSDFDAMSSSVLIESITLANEGYRFDPLPR